MCRWFTARIADSIRNRPERWALLTTAVTGANVGEPTDQYVAQRITRTVVIGLLGWLGTGIFCAILGRPTFGTFPTLVGISTVVGFVGGLVVALVYAIGWIGAVQYRTFERKREMNRLLPDAIAFMYTQSVAGASELDLVRAMARSQDTYGEIAVAFQGIVRETEYAGIDYRTAIANRADITPSEPLSRFLTDMVAIIKSGGDVTVFFEKEAESAVRSTQNELAAELDGLELLANVYLVVSLFPLMGIVVLVIVSVIRPISMTPLYAITYGIIPVVSIMFLVIVAGIRTDELGGGELSDEYEDNIRTSNHVDGSRQHVRAKQPPVGSERQSLHRVGPLAQSITGPGIGWRSTALSFDSVRRRIAPTPILDRYATNHEVFTHIRRGEYRARFGSITDSPGRFLTNRPIFALILGVIATVTALSIGLQTGVVPAPHPESVRSNPLEVTIWWGYVPALLSLGPYALCFEYNRRIRTGLFESIPPTLRKIARSNETGMTLLQSIDAAVADGNRRIDRELRTVRDAIAFGVDVERSLVRFNNHYSNPNIARIVTLLVESRRSTEYVADVLQTAIRSAERRISLNEKQRSRTGVQAVMIVVTTIIMLTVVLVLDRVFLPVIATGGLGTVSSAHGTLSGGGGSEATGIDADLGTVLFLHAVTIHALFSGLIAGYVRTGDLRSGIKYALCLVVVIAVVWAQL